MYSEFQAFRFEVVELTPWVLNTCFFGFGATGGAGLGSGSLHLLPAASKKMWALVLVVARSYSCFSLSYFPCL